MCLSQLGYSHVAGDAACRAAALLSKVMIPYHSAICRVVGPSFVVGLGRSHTAALARLLTRERELHYSYRWGWFDLVISEAWTRFVGGLLRRSDMRWCSTLDTAKTTYWLCPLARSRCLSVSDAIRGLGLQASRSRFPARNRLSWAFSPSCNPSRASKLRSPSPGSPDVQHVLAVDAPCNRLMPSQPPSAYSDRPVCGNLAL